MNRIHQTALIGPAVELGCDNVIGPYTVILGPCTIGDRNWIGPHVVIGTPGEMRGGPHPAAWATDPGVGPVVIGNGNTIREFTTVQQGYTGTTHVGDDCYVMTKAHIPHDGELGDRVTVSCSVMIGGHSIIGNDANLGLGTVIHQRLVIGAGAMVGMGSVVTRDIPPFALAYGNPCRVRGANVVGLQRASFNDDTIKRLDSALARGEDLAPLISTHLTTFEAARSRLADV